MQQQIQNILQESINTKQAVLENKQLLDTIEKVTTIITEAFSKGNKVLFCGNGGSAADAQHLAAEFSGRFYSDRNPLPNDYGYDLVYSRIVKGVGKPGDVLVGLSTSGNSVNIIKAMEQAKEIGMISVSLTGETGGRMKPISDYLINVPSSDTPRIQETHITIGHIICQLVEERLFNK